MYNKQKSSCGGFNGFSNSSGAAVHMYNNQQNGGHFNSTAAVKDWELVEQRDEVKTSFCQVNLILKVIKFKCIKCIYNLTELR